MHKKNQPTEIPLELYPEPEEGTEMHISDLIHKLANDGNVEVDFWIDDRFPFTGLDRRICRDCIFNKSITWEACKCDVATRLKYEVKSTLGFTVNVGIGSNPVGYNIQEDISSSWRQKGQPSIPLICRSIWTL